MFCALLMGFTVAKVLGIGIDIDDYNVHSVLLSFVAY